MFSTVQSLFRYSGHHRELLLRAKEVQDPIAVAGFFDVYSRLVKNFLTNLIVCQKISLIVLPRMSVRRVVSLNWHPVDFWLAQLQQISEELGAAHNFKVFMQPPSPAKRRAQITSLLRRTQVARYKSVGMDLNSRVNKGHSDGEFSDLMSVLLLDDVLTSGGTLLRELEFVLRELSGVSQVVANGAAVGEGERTVLRVPVKAHILTLFRTPVSVSPKDEIA